MTEHKRYSRPVTVNLSVLNQDRLDAIQIALDTSRGKAASYAIETLHSIMVDAGKIKPSPPSS